MCGIAGYWATPKANTKASGLTRTMVDTLVHRGPDAGGLWSDPDGTIALGHRRLSILDLSEQGRQPMMSRSGRWVLTYNGEVYNFRRLRKQLESLGHSFHGSSDTEVVLAAIEQWGVVAAVERFVGMFAFGLYDVLERELWLGRDRVGKKPLYYTAMDTGLAFASELRALRELPSHSSVVDRAALSSYLQFNAVPGTKSIYEGTSRLEPGGLRRFRSPEHTSELTLYWDPAEVVRRGQADEIRDPTMYLEQLDGTLRDAVDLRMESDVPLGAFLSGGVDSSLVAALMQQAGRGRAKTYTIGFEVPRYNEAEHAKAVAAHLGTEHHELYLTPADAREVIPELPRIYDEPFCDASQIPTYLVSRMAKEHVTVCLAGDGGDELFAGYERYPFASIWWRRRGKVPSPLRRAASVAPLRGLSLRLLEGIGWRDRGLLIRDMAAADNPLDFYRTLLATWREPESPVLGVASGLPRSYAVTGRVPNLASITEVGAFADLVAYLPDDILVKVDRASMAVSLEVRAPLLDHRVVELAWRCPMAIKRRDGIAKWPLKQLLYRHVPRSLVDRPKMGFGVPVGAWLRGPLRPWAEDLLSESRLRREGYLRTSAVRRVWREHITGTRDRAPQLWSILMFQAWLSESRLSTSAALYGLDTYSGAVA